MYSEKTRARSVVFFLSRDFEIHTFIFIRPASFVEVTRRKLDILKSCGLRTREMKFQRDPHNESGRDGTNRICSGRDWGTKTNGERWARAKFRATAKQLFPLTARTIPHVCTRVSENSAAKMPGKIVVVCKGRARSHIPSGLSPNVSLTPLRSLLRGTCKFSR